MRVRVITKGSKVWLAPPGTFNSLQFFIGGHLFTLEVTDVPGDKPLPLFPIKALKQGHTAN